MSTTNKLAELISELDALKEEKKSLSDALSETNQKIEQQKANIIARMLDMAEDAGVEDPSDFTVAVDGKRYGIITKQRYSIRKDDREIAFAALRTLGLGDLIQERVDDRSLTKALVELSDENGELPEEYSILPVSVYEERDISARKIASRKK